MPTVTYQVAIDGDSDSQIIKSLPTTNVNENVGITIIGLQSGKVSHEYGMCFRFDVDLDPLTTINSWKFDFYTSASSNEDLAVPRFAYLETDGNWNVEGAFSNYATYDDIPFYHKDEDNETNPGDVYNGTFYTGSSWPLYSAGVYGSFGDDATADVNIPGMAADLESYLADKEALRNQNGATGIPVCITWDHVWVPSVQRSVTIRSRDYSTEAQRPTLTIDYTPPPEPDAAFPTGRPNLQTAVSARTNLEPASSHASGTSRAVSSRTNTLPAVSGRPKLTTAVSARTGLNE